MLNIFEADLSNDTHAGAIIELLNIYAMELVGGGEELQGFVKKNLIPKLKERRDCLVFLAFDNSTPAGLIVGFEGFSTFLCKPLLNIHDFVVAPNYRCQGLALKLLKKAEAIAKERDYCKLTLEVLEGNESAKSVYHRFGFEPYHLNPKMGKAFFWEKKL
ncbi:MAG: GNAT family N-acetyltransferase [Deltaproteobacteria bacterium]|nr:GNAT family N-acetyltransferase [Deltaproteobacteria bacterium]